MKFILSLFITLLISLIFTSCSDETGMTNLEGKIIGTWEFDEVKFRPNGDVFNANYSYGFQGSSITFNADGTLEAYDTDLDTLATGWWYIDFYHEYDDEGDEKKTIYYMVGDLSNQQLEIHKELLWDELSVSKRRISCIEEKDGGKYRYKLIK